MNKLPPNYVDKLTQLLHDGKTTENYPLKRMNLDKAVYKINKNKEFYITLPNFDFQNSSMTSENNNNNYKINNKNISIQNFTENGSNLYTNDTNYNTSKNQMSDYSRRKINVDEYFGNKEEIKLNRVIKELLLNEDKEIMKYTKNLIFKQLNKKYNFIKLENKKLILPKTKLNIRSKDVNINKNINFIFPFKIRNEENGQYLKIMDNNINELYKINNENLNIK